MTKLHEILDTNLLAKMLDGKYVNQTAHPEFPRLKIFNYAPAAVYESVWNDVTRKCRGLIVDTVDYEVLARPFEKFWSASQLEDRPELGVVPENEPFRIFDKADGSLGIVYYKPDGDYAMATRGSFTSDQAQLGSEMLYEHPICDQLRRHEFDGVTLLFEIVGPSNRIVLDYGENKLLLLGGVSIDTGEFHTPRALAPGYDAVDEYSYMEAQRENKEGYVLWYPESNFRVKVKHEEYLRLHAIVTMANTKTIWRALKNNEELELLTLPDEFSGPVQELVNGFKSQFRVLEVEAKYSLAICHEIPTRKEQAEWLTANCNRTVRGVVFRMLDDKSYEDVIWNALEPDQAESIFGFDGDS